jgi:SNF2 family DNA or RNA helicase
MRKSRGQKPMFKVLLTGTPVQNNISELFSLCNFVMPEIFGDRQPFNFVYQQVAPSSSSASQHAAVAFYTQQELRNRIVSKLHALLRRYLLRRTKDQAREEGRGNAAGGSGGGGGRQATYCRAPLNPLIPPRRCT